MSKREWSNKEVLGVLDSQPAFSEAWSENNIMRTLDALARMVLDARAEVEALNEYISSMETLHGIGESRNQRAVAAARIDAQIEALKSVLEWWTDAATGEKKPARELMSRIADLRAEKERFK